MQIMFIIGMKFFIRVMSRPAFGFKIIHLVIHQFFGKEFIKITIIHFADTINFNVMFR